MLIRQQQGSALLLVVGATAAMSALALATLSAALISYEVAALEHEGAAARLLAVSGLELVAAELAAGRQVPSPLAATDWLPALPTAPAGAALPAGCGVRVRLSAADAGPSPPLPLPPGEEPPPLLVDAVAEARCGRGLDRREARFAVAVDGMVRRLY